MLDNFEIITSYLKKVEKEIKLDRSYDNIVWYLQILKRKKDNPDTVASNNQLQVPKETLTLFQSNFLKQFIVVMTILMKM